MLQPKNARSRKVVEARASGNGATLPQEIVDEAITLSNMYNLDEQVALDLLCTGRWHHINMYYVDFHTFSQYMSASKV